MSYDTRELRELVCRLGAAMWQRGFVAGNDGNLSVRLPDGNVLCTPTQVSKGFMTPQSLPVVDLDGEVVVPSSEGLRPSSEMRMHLRVYRRRTDVGAVVHAHPLHATSFAVRGRGLDTVMMPEQVVAMPVVPLAVYATPSTDAVPDSIEPYLSSGSCCLLEQHGALTWGPDLMTAYQLMERVEYNAAMANLLELTGGMRELAPDEIARIRSLFGGAGY